MQTLVVVGASLAGLSAARAARAQGFTGRLVIIGDEHHRPYDRPPLSKDFLLGTITTQDLFLETDGDGLDAEWILGVGAVGLDAASLTIRLADGRSIAADRIVIATGARCRKLPALEGMENVFYLRTIADAERLAPKLIPGDRMVVIGAGFIGAEAAPAAAARGMDVTMINNNPVPFTAQLGSDMGAAVASLHTSNGVSLVCGVAIEQFDTADGEVTGLSLADGRRLPTNVVVVGIGAEPNVEWLEGSGIELCDGVLCDSMGRTNIPGIVAVGDCAAWFDEGLGRHRRVEHWTGALERAALAVQALIDNDAPQQPLKPPYFWSDQHGVKIQFAGHSAGYDRLEIEAGDPQEHSFLAVYYRGETPVAVLGMNQPRLFTRWRRSIGIPGAKPAAARLVSKAAS